MPVSWPIQLRKPVGLLYSKLHLLITKNIYTSFTKGWRVYKQEQIWHLSPHVWTFFSMCMGFCSRTCELPFSHMWAFVPYVGALSRRRLSCVKQRKKERNEWLIENGSCEEGRDSHTAVWFMGHLRTSNRQCEGVQILVLEPLQFSKNWYVLLIHEFWLRSLWQNGSLQQPLDFSYYFLEHPEYFQGRIGFLQGSQTFTYIHPLCAVSISWHSYMFII